MCRWHSKNSTEFIPFPHIEYLELHKNLIHLDIILIGLPQFAFDRAILLFFIMLLQLLVCAVQMCAPKPITANNLWNSGKFSRKQRCIIHKPCDREIKHINHTRRMPQLRLKIPIEHTVNTKHECEINVNVKWQAMARGRGDQERESAGQMDGSRKIAFEVSHHYSLL